MARGADRGRRVRVGRKRTGTLPVSPCGRLQRGDRVRIKRGPLSQQVGLYQGMSAHNRVRVLLTLLGGKTTALVAERDVVSVH
jgi:transcription antitermination factor NusG